MTASYTLIIRTAGDAAETGSNRSDTEERQAAGLVDLMATDFRRPPKRLVGGWGRRS